MTPARLLRITLFLLGTILLLSAGPGAAGENNCTYPCNNPGGACPTVAITGISPIAADGKFTVTVTYSGAQWMKFGFWYPGVEWACSEAPGAECSSAAGTHTKVFPLTMPCLQPGETVRFYVSVDACRANGRPDQWAPWLEEYIPAPGPQKCDPQIPLGQSQAKQPNRFCENKDKDCKEELCGASPCLAASGAYETLALDLQIPTNGFPLSLGRVYSSAHAIDGPLGPGWTSSLDSRIYYTTAALGSPATSQTTSYNEAEVVLPDGTHRTFRAPGPTLPTTTPITFNPPTGRSDTLVRNPDGSWDLTVQHSLSVYHFDPTGRLETMTDDFGNRLRLTYDGLGRIQRVADESGSGRDLDVYWGPNGRIADVVDHAGRAVHYLYEPSGVLAKVIDPENRETTYLYTAGRYAPLLAGVRDHWGRATTDLTWEMNSFNRPTGRLASYTEEGETYSYVYQEGQTLKTDSGGRSWTFPYQSNDLITQRQGPDGTSSTSYDANGRVSVSLDPVGVRTEYDWFGDGRLARVRQALGTADQVRYDYGYDASFPWKVTSVVPKDPDTSAVDRDWQETRYEYYSPGAAAPGSLHKVLRVKANGSSEVVTTYEYDTKGRVTRVLDALGNATDYAYDTSGNLATVTRPANDDLGTRPVVSYGYDALGRVTTITEGQAITEITYDAVDRVTQTKVRKNGACNAGEVCEFLTGVLYDQYEAGLQRLWVHQTDANGIVTKQAYDAYGRLVVSRDAENNDTRYNYANKHLVGITDANDYTTGYLYDAAGRLRKTIFPDGAEESYTYAADGLLATKTDRKGNVIGYLYDAHKRLVDKVYNNGADGTIHFVYEGQKLVRVENRSQGVNEDHVYTYDTGYRTASEQQGPRGTVRWEYDVRDQVSRMSVDGGPVTDYTYYPDGSMNTITWSLVSGQFKYRYTPEGQYATVTFPNGQSRNYSYDWAGRLLQLANLHPTTGNLATYTYGYDVDWATGLKTKKGQRTSMTADVPAQNFTGALTKYYYDIHYQLTGADYPAAVPFNGEVARWAYDAIGNRTNETVNGVTANYTYQKIGVNPKNWQRLDSLGSQVFSYDPEGQMTVSAPAAGVTHSFNYNLDGSQTQSDTTTYQYDWLGRRTKTGETEYVYWSFEPLQRVGDGSARMLVPGDNRTDAEYGGGQLAYFVASDHSNNLAVRPDGSLAGYRTFDAWGNARTTGGLGTGTIEVESTTRGLPEGFEFRRYRTFATQHGRFTQTDPLFKRLGSGVRQYAYAASDPVNLGDPSGLFVLRLVDDRRNSSRLRRSDRIWKDCRKSGTKVSCTNIDDVDVDCFCMCSGAGWMPTIVVSVTAQMYVLNSTNPQDWIGRTKDRSIKDEKTAVEHEWDKHLTPGANAIRPHLQPYEVPSENPQDCEDRCSKVTTDEMKNRIKSVFYWGATREKI